MQVAAGAAFHTTSATDGRHDTVSGVGRWGFGGAPFVGMEAPGKVRAPSSLLTSGPHIPHRPEPLNADILSETKN